LKLIIIFLIIPFIFNCSKYEDINYVGLHEIQVDKYFKKNWEKYVITNPKELGYSKDNNHFRIEYLDGYGHLSLKNINYFTNSHRVIFYAADLLSTLPIFYLVKNNNVFQQER